MAKKCAIIPKVRNTKGEVVDSKLFIDLHQLTSKRSEAANLYLITKNTEFQNKWDSVLSFDNNGEPTVASLISKTNIREAIDDKVVLNTLSKQLGKEVLPSTLENNSKLADKAVQFNRNSDFKEDFVATIDKNYNPKTNNIEATVTPKRRTKTLSNEARNMEYNQILNNKIKDILASQGVSIGALTALEKRRGIAGVADFSLAKDAAKGTIALIRLAEGIKGEQALPEEFAHYAIEAMGDNPLVNRLVNLIAKNNLTQELLGEDYSTYESLYQGSRERLAKEAAGKLLATHLLRGEPTSNRPYKNLLDRAISAIKNFFKGLNANAIQKAMIQADKEFGKLATTLLTDAQSLSMSVGNITTSEQFFSTKERVDRDKKLLKDIIDNERKRLKIYEKRNPDSKFETEQRLLIDKLELSLENNEEIQGIYDFLDTALEDMTKVETRLRLLMGTPSTSLGARAGILRDIRNYIYSYSGMMSEIREVARDAELNEDNRYGERAMVSLNQVESLIKNLLVDYNRVAVPMFTDFIKPFFGQDIIVEMGKDKGKVIKVEDLINYADNDIGIFDRWLDSMADSSDYMLKLFDQAVKKSKETARQKTIELSKELIALGVKAEQDGIKDTEWLFEKDSKGNKTGNYVSAINHGLFKEAMSKMFKSQREKYGKNPIDSDRVKMQKEINDWFRENMETVNEQRIPKVSKYGNKDYQNLSPKYKEYHTKLMEIKERLDALLPDKFTKTNNAIKIRKDLLERVKQSKGAKGGAKQIWENLKDQVVRRTDDTDFEFKSTLMDFEGRQVETLPIFYTQMSKNENANDISTDVIGTMIAYASMAYDFNEMSKIIDVLEVGRDIMRNRKITETAGGKAMQEKFKSVGKMVTNKLIKNRDESNFIGRLNDFFTMQVYNKYMKDEGTLGKTNVDIGKLANLLNRVTSLNSLALNALSGISNIATGTVMMRIESFAKEFFTEKDTVIADSIYARELSGVLSEMGNRVKTNKLNLFSELFDTMQEFEQDVRDVNFDRKTWFSRMFNTSGLFFINNAGEHWMQNRTALAVANAYKMKGPDGKVTSLWNAMEVVYIDKHNKKLGARLQVRPGFTKEDGTVFNSNDIFRLTRKTAAINQRLHGVYNKADRSAIQRVALGRLGMMFRKWMKPSLNRRFKSASKNLDLDAWTEGYYRTAFNFMQSVAKDLKQLKFTLGAHYNKLSKSEKANIRRALTELAHFFSLAALLGLMDFDDDKDRGWVSSMTEYQMRRLYTELGAMTPTPAMVSEGFRILKSPAAGINTAEKLGNFIGFLNWNNYEFISGEDAILQSGPYKGMSRAEQLFFKSPLAPMYNTAMRTIHINDQIQFFKQ